MPLKFDNIEAFAQTYPHLMEKITVVQPNDRKIMTALSDGWPLIGVQVIEGAEESASAAASKPASEAAASEAAASETAAGEANAPKEGIGTQAGKTPPHDEEKGKIDVLLPILPTNVPKSFDEKHRYPKEETRGFFRRMQVREEAERLEKEAREKAGLK